MDESFVSSTLVAVLIVVGLVALLSL